MILSINYSYIFLYESTIYFLLLFQNIDLFLLCSSKYKQFY